MLFRSLVLGVVLVQFAPGADPGPVETSERPRRPTTPPVAPRQGRQPRPDEGATTDVFGVHGTGSRFVYLLDRSASMANRGQIALDAARREVAESLGHLHKGNEFAVLFFADTVERFPEGNGAADFAPFSADAVRHAKDRLRRVRATGHGGHARAIEEALVMNPDVVFLITD